MIFISFRKIIHVYHDFSFIKVYELIVNNGFILISSKIILNKIRVIIEL